MAPIPQSDDTRERILVAASRLFAVQGFAGTSTRQVAEAVGIRQPSIFHHFATKTAILQELIHRDLVPARRHLAHWFDADGPVAARLGAYLMEDLEWLMGSKFDNRGLYSDELLAHPEFAEEALIRREFHGALERFVEAGISSGEFRDLDVELAREMIVAVNLDTIRATGSVHNPLGRTHSVVEFLLRGLLADPTSVGRVMEAAIGLRTTRPPGPA